MGGLLDFITGGADDQAKRDLENTLASIQGIQTPTASDLQLSPLAPYVETGELPPALAQAAEAGPSAFNSENLSKVPISTMQQVLAREKEIADSNGMTPQEIAQIAQAEETVNENTAGQRGAISADFAQRGIPASLISAALQNGTVGQEAEQNYLNALQAEGSAANLGQTALANEGALAGNLFNAESGQANTVAAAQDALSKFNAANTQQTNLANQANTQAANVYDTTNKQNISNENVTGKHQVQIQNQVEAPQEAAALALEKGKELAGVGEAQSGQQMAQGQQAAGLFGGLLGAGSTLGSGALQAGATNNLATAIAAADGGEIPPRPTIPAANFKGGGPVPGQARVAGDSQANDTVPARLSPGEVVIPRTVAQNPGPRGSNVQRFLQAKVPQMAAKMEPHPSDIASIIRALSEIRGGA